MNLDDIIQVWITEKGHIMGWYFAPSLPQPRQNRNSRWGTSKTAEACKRYNNWRGAFRDALTLAMKAKGIEPLGKKSLIVRFKFTDDRIFFEVWENERGGKGHRSDLSNHVKAGEDVFNEVLWADDRWVDCIDAVRL